MTIRKFAKYCSSFDDPIGDVARDILEDSEFPFNKSDKRVKEYLNNVSSDDVVNEAIKQFLELYEQTKKQNL